MLETRLKQQGKSSKEALDYISDWGFFWASQEYKCTSGALRAMARRAGRHENFGINPKYGGLGGSGGNDIFETVRKKMESYVANTTKQIAVMDIEIERLKQENEILCRNNYRLFGNKLLAIVDTMGE